MNRVPYYCLAGAHLLAGAALFVQGEDPLFACVQLAGAALVVLIAKLDPTKG